VAISKSLSEASFGMNLNLLDRIQASKHALMKIRHHLNGSADPWYGYSRYYGHGYGLGYGGYGYGSRYGGYGHGYGYYGRKKRSAEAEATPVAEAAAEADPWYGYSRYYGHGYGLGYGGYGYGSRYGGYGRGYGYWGRKKRSAEATPVADAAAEAEADPWGGYYGNYYGRGYGYGSRYGYSGYYNRGYGYGGYGRGYYWG